jgi:hypothetical protein
LTTKNLVFEEGGENVAIDRYTSVTRVTIVEKGKISSDLLIIRSTLTKEQKGG